MPRPYGKTHPDFARLVARDPSGLDPIEDAPDDEDEDDLEDIEESSDEIDTSDYRRFDDGVSDLRGSLEIWKLGQNR